MEQQMEEKMNQHMGIIEQCFLEQLQQQQQIQKALEEKICISIHSSWKTAGHASTCYIEDDDMAEVEDEPLEKLLTKLHKLKIGLVVLEWELRVFGLHCHVPLYINLNDALEIVAGDKMLNISILKLWCM